MQNQDQNNNDELDFGPEIAKAKVSPILKWSIVIMSVLIVVALVVIISTIIYRAVKLGDRGSSRTYPTRGFGTVNLDITQGAKVGEVKLDGNRMSIVIKRAAGGDEIVIIDVRTGDVLGRIQLKEK